MKNIISNAGYFLQETITMIRQSLLSNILSILSTGLIFFILAMVISGWWVSNHVADVIQGEAEINVFYNESIGNNGVSQLMEKIQGLAGVREVRLVDKSEAYNRMVEILGDEANVLKIFDENPFSPFIEVKIKLDEINSILNELNHITGIDHVQNNKDVLDRLHNISGMLRLFGFLVVVAVGISTMVIISQIIRLGIHNNSEQINTLRLLGAPESFIAFPFLIEGLLITVGGGILAVSLATFVLNQVYVRISGQLSFIPLLPSKTLIPGMVVAVMALSLILGTGGSLIGLKTARGK